LKNHDSFAETDQSIFYNHRQSCRSAIEYNMKNLAAILAITVIFLGLTPGISYAELNSDREAWDHIELGSVGLQNDGSVSEDEGNMFQEVIILGRKGETEDAIKALNEFLRGNRNNSLREVTREAYVQLVKERKEIADYTAMHAKDKPSCDLEMRICKSGEIVGRVEPKCTFAPCPG
jgi:hypothetical protein